MVCVKCTVGTASKRPSKLGKPSNKTSPSSVVPRAPFRPPELEPLKIYKQGKKEQTVCSNGANPITLALDAAASELIASMLGDMCRDADNFERSDQLKKNVCKMWQILIIRGRHKTKQYSLDANKQINSL